MIKSWSSTQKVVALSSGEAEYYGLVKGSAMGKGSQALLADMGRTLKLQVLTDSSAAKGMGTRRGHGKVRHVEVCQLWVQHEVRRNSITIVKVKGVIT